ncbi:MAG: cytochrome oxidase assembly protein, partial [Pseudomonadota bacterium]
LHFDTGTRGRWTLVYKTSGGCDDTCEKALIDIRQIRLATGREIDRIERLLIIDAEPDNISPLREQHPGLKFSTDFNSADVPFHAAVESLDDNKLYIMDPLGNVILRYAPAPERKAFLADLKKLLKASRIG